MKKMKVEDIPDKVSKCCDYGVSESPDPKTKRTRKMCYQCSQELLVQDILPIDPDDRYVAKQGEWYSRFPAPYRANHINEARVMTMQEFIAGRYYDHNYDPVKVTVAWAIVERKNVQVVNESK